MIVERSTFKAKPGRREELVALLMAEGAAEQERSEDVPPFRCYTSNIGQDDQVALEWEFESLAEREEYWAEWSAKPTTAGFMEKYRELTTGGGSREIWNLVEQE